MLLWVQTTFSRVVTTISPTPLQTLWGVLWVRRRIRKVVFTANDIFAPFDRFYHLGVPPYVLKGVTKQKRLGKHCVSWYEEQNTSWKSLLNVSNRAYSIHTVPLFFFGVNAFELVGISFLVFLAAIALVVLVTTSRNLSWKLCRFSYT